MDAEAIAQIVESLKPKDADQHSLYIEVDTADGTVDVPVQLVQNGGAASLAVFSEAQKAGDDRASRPRFRVGERRLEDLASFLAYVNAYKTDQAVAFARKEVVQVTAIFDYHAPGGSGAPGWKRDRVAYQAKLSKPNGPPH